MVRLEAKQQLQQADVFSDIFWDTILAGYAGDAGRGHQSTLRYGTGLRDYGLKRGGASLGQIIVEDVRISDCATVCLGQNYRRQVSVRLLRVLNVDDVIARVDGYGGRVCVVIRPTIVTTMDVSVVASVATAIVHAVIPIVVRRNILESSHINLDSLRARRRVGLQRCLV